jgi:hypothetical protein
LFASSLIYLCRENGVIYSILVSLAFLTEGGHFSTFPVCAVKIFGIVYGGKIYSIICFAIPLSSLAGFFIDYYRLVDELYIFVVAAELTFINIILLIFFDETEIKVYFDERPDGSLKRNLSSYKDTWFMKIKDKLRK